MSYIEVFHLVFEGLTALGTIGAVIISLWLASYSLKVKARGEIDFATFYIPSSTDHEMYSPQEEFVRITITNIGKKSFTVVNNFISYDRKNKTYFQAMPNYQHNLCTSPNFVFMDTSTGNYLFPLETFIENFINLLGLKETKDKKIIMKRLKDLNFYAITNTGDKIFINYASDFLDNWATLIMDKIMA